MHDLPKNIQANEKVHYACQYHSDQQAQEAFLHHRDKKSHYAYKKSVGREGTLCVPQTSRQTARHTTHTEFRKTGKCTTHTCAGIGAPPSFDFLLPDGAGTCQTPSDPDCATARKDTIFSEVDGEKDRHEGTLSVVNTMMALLSDPFSVASHRLMNLSPAADTRNLRDKCITTQELAHSEHKLQQNLELDCIVHMHKTQCAKLSTQRTDNLYKSRY